MFTVAPFTVLQDPQTQIVLLGQNATFTCKGIGEADLSINDQDPVGNAEHLKANNITWDIAVNGSVTTFIVNILATLSNNYTNIQCSFENNGNPHHSHIAHLIAVSGKKHRCAPMHS